MATLRMPDRLAREVIFYFIASAPSTRRSNDLLGTMISAFGGLPVERARIATDKRGRHADVVVAAVHGRQFTTLFPGAILLGEGARGTLVFHLSGSPVGGTSSSVAARER